MYLYINTSEDQTDIRLYSTEFVLVADHIWAGAKNQTDELLLEIESLLHKEGLDKKKLLGILACPGPGSYTGIRVGIATANALAFSLNIPIWAVDKVSCDSNEAMAALVSQAPLTQVKPFYQNPPHITKPKA